jgi:hypothetical protein
MMGEFFGLLVFVIMLALLGNALISWGVGVTPAVCLMARDIFTKLPR